MTLEETSDYEQPIITYLNGLLKQMTLINAMFSDYRTNLIYLATPIRVLISNLPPSGQTALKEELKRLEEFEGNTSTIPNKIEMEKIYKTVHNWAYEKLFQDAFKLSPRIKGAAHLK